MLEIHAPAVEALLRDPILHEYGTHAFIVTLRLSFGFIAISRNMMEHYRLAAASSNSVTPQGVTDTKNRMLHLVVVIEHVQGLIDAELKKLKFGVVRTSEESPDDGPLASYPSEIGPSKTFLN